MRTPTERNKMIRNWHLGIYSTGETGNCTHTHIDLSRFVRRKQMFPIDFIGTHRHHRSASWWFRILPLITFSQKHTHIHAHTEHRLCSTRENRVLRVVGVHIIFHSINKPIKKHSAEKQTRTLPRGYTDNAHITKTIFDLFSTS